MFIFPSPIHALYPASASANKLSLHPEKVVQETRRRNAPNWILLRKD